MLYNYSGKVNNNMSHIGQNIARIRGMRRLTQKEMASKLNLAQPEYSKIEQKMQIDDNLLNTIANALEISPEAIKNFNEEAAVNIISSTLNDQAGSYNHCPVYNFNPIDKLLEIVEENRKLYELLLKEKEEMIQMYKRQQAS